MAVDSEEEKLQTKMQRKQVSGKNAEEWKRERETHF